MARESSGACVYQEPNLPWGSAGVAWAHSPAHWRPRHFHRELELNLVTQGRGTFRVDGRELELTAGQLLWFPPYTGHELSSASADFDMWVVTFRPDFVEHFERHSRNLTRILAVRRPDVVPLSKAGFPSLDGALRAVNQVCAGRAPEASLLGGVLEGLVAETDLARNAGNPLHPIAHRARAQLGKEPNLGRRELARRLGVSESTLAHVFKRHIGVALDEYKNRARLARLLEILDAGDRSLLDAALAAGFGSSAQYHRCVRALTGYRPSDLQRADARRALAEQVRIDQESENREFGAEQGPHGDIEVTELHRGRRPPKPTPRCRALPPR